MTKLIVRKSKELWLLAFRPPLFGVLHSRLANVPIEPMLSVRSHYFVSFTTLLALNACEKDPSGAKPPSQSAAQTENQASSQPTSQPSSQPASQATSQPTEKPSDHPKAFEPVKLADMFAMPKTETDTVIKVKDRIVSRKEFETKLRVMQVQLTAAGLPDDLTRESVLTGAVTQVVEPLLMKQIADELGINLDQKLYESQLAELNARIEKDEYFKAFLKKAGNTPEQRAIDMKHETLSFQIRDHLLKIAQTETATSVQAYYEKNKRDYIERAGTQTWRIFIRAPQNLPDRDREASRLKAESIHKKATAKKKDFENLARLYSEGGKAAQGGYIGWISPGTFAEKLDKQLQEARPNSVLPVYDDATGFYIYKTGKKRAERVKELEEVKDKILKKMFRRVVEKKLSEKLKALRNSINVEILIPELTQN